MTPSADRRFDELVGRLRTWAADRRGVEVRVLPERQLYVRARGRFEVFVASRQPLAAGEEPLPTARVQPREPDAPPVLEPDAAAGSWQTAGPAGERIEVRAALDDEADRSAVEAILSAVRERLVDAPDGDR